MNSLKVKNRELIHEIATPLQTVLSTVSAINLGIDLNKYKLDTVKDDLKIVNLKLEEIGKVISVIRRINQD